MKQKILNFFSILNFLGCACIFSCTTVYASQYSSCVFSLTVFIILGMFRNKQLPPQTCLRGCFEPFFNRDYFLFRKQQWKSTTGDGSAVKTCTKGLSAQHIDCVLPPKGEIKFSKRCEFKKGTILWSLWLFLLFDRLFALKDSLKYVFHRERSQQKALKSKCTLVCRLFSWHELSVYIYVYRRSKVPK